MDQIKSLGLRIRALRTENGISQERLSELCELDRTYISAVERGTRNPTLKNILKIASALHVSPADLFE